MTQDKPTLKLSQKQKQVIELMRDGWELSYNNSRIFGDWISFKNGFEERIIRKDTIDILCSHGLLKDTFGAFHVVTITELGRTIKL